MTDTHTCPTRINTKIDADGKQIFAAAKWLQDAESSFRDAASDVDYALTDNFRSLSGEFSGEFSEAILSYGREFMNNCRGAAGELEVAANTIEAWGDQINWRKEDMAKCRDRAREGGLEVHGEVITLPPSSSGSDAGDSDQKEKCELMEKLAKDVKKIRDMLTTWVDEHMKVDGRDLKLFTIVEGIGSGAESAVLERTVPNAYADVVAEMESRHLQKKGIDGGFLLEDVRSDAKKRAGLAWKRANTANALLLSGSELATSDKPGDSAVSIANGAVATRIIATIGAGPVVTTIAIPIITWGLDLVYENTVTLRTRERNNERLRDLRDGYTDGSTDAEEKFTHDVVEKYL